MRTALINILQGAGSILDIMPEREKACFRKKTAKRTAMAIMTSAWLRVGKDIEKSIGEYAHDQKIKVIPDNHPKDGKPTDSKQS
jgi:hypothetical protein